MASSSDLMARSTSAISTISGFVVSIWKRVERRRWPAMETGAIAATAASLNMPHEIQFHPNGDLYIVERDSHVVRKVDNQTGIISTVVGTGIDGFSGDGGPAAAAQLRRPHSLVFDPNGDLLICDIGNHRIRRVDLASGTISTFGGTGERGPTPDGAPFRGTPLNGPRAMALDPDGSL